MPIKPNKWVCDCRLLWLRELYINGNITDNGKPLYCNRPLRFQGRKLVDLSVQDLVQWVEADGCPPSCDCTCIDDIGNFFIKVDCSSRNLTEAPLTFPEQIGELNLEDNLITRLFLNVSILSNLKILNLEMNFLTDLNFVLPQNVTALKLANNNITRFFDKPTATVSLWTLSNNPWICDCKTKNFRTWMLSHNKQISDINDTRCSTDNSRENLRNKVIRYLSEDDLCPPMISTYVIAAVSFLIVLLIGTSSRLLYSHYHYHMKVWLYSRGITWLKSEEERDCGKIYDAFISSADEDFHLVKDFILPELELKDPFYTIFEPRRNMKAGEMFEFEKEMEEATNSKRVIILLSENYIHNNFLMEVFKTAFATSLEEKLYRLILIVVGDLPPLPDMEQSLKAAIESTRCLRFGQKLFWEMLRFAMPKTAQNTGLNVWENTSEDVPLLQS